MNWLLTALLSCLLVECLLRLPLAALLVDFRRVTLRALHVLRAKAISDHWKEKAMGAYAKGTLAASSKLASLLGFLLALAWVLTLLFEQASRGFQAFLLGWLGLAAGCLFACLYYVARKVLLHGRL